jgi:hypothetical protein
LQSSEQVKPKVLFLVIASGNPENESDLKAQLSTWLKDLPLNYSYIILRGSDANEFCLEKKTLLVPVIERYENILAKTILGITWALQNLEFDILIRTNVSTYFSRIHLDELMSGIDLTSNYFGGYIERCKDPFNYNQVTIPFVTGTALVMTRPVAEILTDLPVVDFSSIPDDVAISNFIRNKGIKVSPLKRNNFSELHIFLPTFQIRLKTSKNSYLASKRMIDIHTFFTERRTLMKPLKYLLIMGKELTYIDFQLSSSLDYLSRIRTSLTNKFRSRWIWR